MSVIIGEVMIFKAMENVWRKGDIRHSELALKKGKRVSLEFDKTRQFQSYVHEFCGKFNLKPESVRFSLGRKVVPMHKCPKYPVEIGVA